MDNQVICIAIAAVILLVLCVGCLAGGKKIGSGDAKSTLNTYLQHNGEEFYKYMPKDCRKAVLKNYDISKEDYEKTIDTYAMAIYGKSYCWNFSIDDREYDVKPKHIKMEKSDTVTYKALRKWEKNKNSSTENDLNSWAAKDQTLKKIDAIAEIWDGILDTKYVQLVEYTYDCEYVENKSGKEGVDEDEKLTLTFVKCKGDWYCLEILDIAVNGIKSNANNAAAEESWNKYFGSSD